MIFRRFFLHIKELPPAEENVLEKVPINEECPGILSDTEASMKKLI